MFGKVRSKKEVDWEKKIEMEYRQKVGDDYDYKEFLDYLKQRYSEVN